MFGTKRLVVVVVGLLALAVPAQSWAAPPANDNFADAIVLPGASGRVDGTNVDATIQGATAKLTFVGREVAFVSTKGPDRGRIAVSLDGGAWKTIDLDSGSTKARQIVYSRGGATAAAHTLAIRVLRSKKSTSMHSSS